MHTEGQGFESLQFHGVQPPTPTEIIRWHELIRNEKEKICRLSSVGRAFGLHPKGREFESLSLYAAEWIVFAISVDKGLMYNKTTGVIVLLTKK